MRFLVVGAGRLGRALAHDLLLGGHEVRVLDDTQERLSRLPADLGEHAVHGSALEHETLSRALGDCDGIAAATRVHLQCGHCPPQSIERLGRPPDVNQSFWWI